MDIGLQTADGPSPTANQEGPILENWTLERNPEWLFILGTRAGG